MSKVAASYSSKSTAVRGALRAGLAEDAFLVEQNAEGRWIVLIIPSKQDEFEADEAELAAQQVRPTTIITEVEGTEGLEPGVHTVQVEKVRKVRGKDAVRITMKVVDEPTTKEAKPLSYKQLPRLAKSEVEKPLSVIFTFLDANLGLTRKQAVSELVAMGINFYTARTQYQKWYTKRKEAK